MFKNTSYIRIPNLLLISNYPTYTKVAAQSQTKQTSQLVAWRQISGKEETSDFWTSHREFFLLVCKKQQMTKTGRMLSAEETK